MIFYIYIDANRQWRWRLAAANGRIVANSGEGYHNRQDCLSAISLVKSTALTPVREA